MSFALVLEAKGINPQSHESPDKKEEQNGELLSEKQFRRKSASSIVLDPRPSLFDDPT